MRRIALQSALGGMLASIVGHDRRGGRHLAAYRRRHRSGGHRSFAVLNAVRTVVPAELQDF